ncbi:hypothetical protein PG993_014646 [Apiospora rasikravindrae]|uniref:Uncharacterized protein n=1 Tax=Apiospora rasikravindrae TaxID=990691 RepID=A0ABR1RNH5_9PEZI
MPNSPINGTSSQNPSNSNSYVPLGRPYNPLQYIRNRKVRARERKAIDGEAQGFSDVPRVTDWVDQAAACAAASPFMPGPGPPPIPPFPGTQMSPSSQKQPSSIPVPVSATAKPKRPRMDWMIDPADMLADVNWVEQSDNKLLLEDRHYARIFPTPAAASSRPLSNQGEESAASSLRARQSSEHGHDDIYIEPKPSDSNAISKADTDHSHTSARERARHKLHELRGMHHRHNSSVHSHHDFLNFRRSSFSDTSESETDRKRRGRSGTVSADSKAILEKQMNELMAREATEDRKRSLDEESDNRNQIHSTHMTSDKSFEPPAQGHAQVGSRVDDRGDPEKTMRAPVRQSSPVRSFRESLEVPDFNSRFSMDLDSSAPPSPDLKPIKRRNNFISGTGTDLSPQSSRPSSPTRNPFSKVKSMFRDRSRDRERERDRGVDHVNVIKEESIGSPIEPVESSTLSPASTESLGNIGRARSRSPAPKIASRNTGESHKSHKSMGSLRLGRDDQIGLRTIFKGGAKIDGIIRGGVSKVSDLLWKKDQDDDGSTSDTSSDESDHGLSKGRSDGSEPISQTESTLPQENRQAKHYLDVMPTFKPASDVDKSASPEAGAHDVPVDVSSPPNRRSSRFDKLKPPRIDVMSASPLSTPLAQLDQGDLFASDVSESESDERRRSQRNSTGQLNGVLTVPALSQRQRDSLGRSRHWSISDPSSIPQRKTQLSKREAARLRALVLSSGIKAMEIARRFEEPRALSTLQGRPAGLSWDDLSQFTPAEQANLAVSQRDLYATSARILSSGVETSSFALEKQMHAFAQNEVRHLHGRADALHQRVATELIDMTRRAADDADECSRDINDGQRLKVKHVLDVIDTLMRRKRRRFRWARRGGWLMVEWALVGLMWYVWFVVMIARIFMGIGSGIVGMVKWLLWL